MGGKQRNDNKETHRAGAQTEAAAAGPPGQGLGAKGHQGLVPAGLGQLRPARQEAGHAHRALQERANPTRRCSSACGPRRPRRCSAMRTVRKREREKEFPAWAIAKKRAVEDALAEQRRAREGRRELSRRHRAGRRATDRRTCSGRGCSRITEHRRAHPDVVRRRAAGRVSEATVPLATGDTEAPSYIYLQVWVERGSGKSYQRNTGTVPAATEAGHQRRGAGPLHPHACDPPSPVRTASFGTAARTGRQPGEDLAEQAGARGVSRASRANGSARGRHHRVRRAQRVSYAARLRSTSTAADPTRICTLPRNCSASTSASTGRF